MVASGIGVVVVFAIYTFVARVINSRVKEEGKINAAEDVRRLDAAIKKSSDKQVAGSAVRIESNLQPCARPTCPGIAVNSSTTRVTIASGCVPGPAPEAARMNGAITSCLDPNAFPGSKCPAGQRPVVQFTETELASGTVISTWIIPFPPQRGASVTQSGNSGASICVTKQGDNHAIDLDQVVLSQGGDGVTSTFKRSLIFPGTVITGYQIR